MERIKRFVKTPAKFADMESPPKKPRNGKKNSVPSAVAPKAPAMSKGILASLSTLVFFVHSVLVCSSFLGCLCFSVLDLFIRPQNPSHAAISSQKSTSSGKTASKILSPAASGNLIERSEKRGKSCNYYMVLFSYLCDLREEILCHKGTATIISASSRPSHLATDSEDDEEQRSMNYHFSLGVSNLYTNFSVYTTGDARFTKGNVVNPSALPSTPSRSSASLLKPSSKVDHHLPQSSLSTKSPERPKPSSKLTSPLFVLLFGLILLFDCYVRETNSYCGQ